MTGLEPASPQTYSGARNYQLATWTKQGREQLSPFPAPTITHPHFRKDAFYPSLPRSSRTQQQTPHHAWSHAAAYRTEAAPHLAQPSVSSSHHWIAPQPMLPTCFAHQQAASSGNPTQAKATPQASPYLYPWNRTPPPPSAPATREPGTTNPATRPNQPQAVSHAPGSTVDPSQYPTHRSVGNQR